MNPLQFIFRKGVSTADALLSFIESVCESIDSDKVVKTAILYLSKTFDYISHVILMEKLNLIGFDSDAENLIKNFLSNRLQRIQLDTIYSIWKKIFRGVHKGSVLGPLLFKLYENYLCKSIDSNVTMIQYADDCLVFASNIHENIKQKIPWN